MSKRQKVRILIVDDNTSFSNVAKSFLEQKNYSVRTLENPESALDLIKKENFHILVLDLKMPGVSGAELLSRIRKYDPHLCVIVVTGYPSVESALETMKMSAYDYLQKPFDMNVLADVIGRAINELGIFTDPEEELKKNIGSTLRKLRKENGFTLKNLSSKTGLSQSLISKIELGNTSASIATLLKLANALNVHIKVFFD